MAQNEQHELPIARINVFEDRRIVPPQLEKLRD